MDAVCTSWDRLLSKKKDLHKCTLDGEEEFLNNTPWSSVYKLEAVVKKCGRPSEETHKKLKWAILKAHDSIRNKVATGPELTVRTLSGKGLPNSRGQVDYWLFQYALKEYIGVHLLGTLPLEPDVISELPSFGMTLRCTGQSMATPTRLSTGSGCRGTVRVAHPYQDDGGMHLW